MPASHPVPIRRLTLYKHGVAFVEREGAFEGDLLTLPFRGDELNDALKSLLILDATGAAAVGVTYETPIPADERLADTPLRLSADRSLLDILSALRGRAVRLALGDGDQRREVTGRVVGLDTAGKRRRFGKGTVTLLDDETGALLQLALPELRHVQINDSEAREDLLTFLAASADPGARRLLRLHLEPGGHDLRISYLVPSPTWRVSYRVVAEAAEDRESGSLLLQGWGIFDNRFGEDLANVTVTLVAGQPISFRYDLTTSTTPTRRLVHDEARIAPGPVAFEQGSEDAVHGAVPDGARRGGREFYMLRSAPRAPAPAASPWRQENVETSAERFAVATDQGELFAYQVAAPVTAPRNASALVPVLQATLPYRRLLLFNRAKLPNHPVAAFTFVNRSGLTLERGPATVLEDGAYRGEAVIPFTRDADEVYLASATELGVHVAVNTWTTSERVGLRITGGLLHFREADVAHVRFEIQNNLPQQRAITLEERRDPGAELTATRAPDGQTPDHYRWVVVCPARQTTRFEAHQRAYRWKEELVSDQSYEQLAQYLTRHWLDAAALAQLRAILAEHDALRHNREEEDRLAAERTQIHEREEQLRRNIAALGAVGAEGAFRESVVQRLQECEARVDVIAARLVTLKADTERREAVIQQELASLDVNMAPEGAGDA